MKNCQWCGKPLEVKATDTGKTYRYHCAKCGFKLKEIAKPEQPVKQEQPRVVEITEAEKPYIRPLAKWPFVIGAIAVVALVVILVKAFLL